MACIDSSKLDDCEQFFVKIWKQIYGDRNGIPLFHYDSQTILITCATALTVLNLPKQTRLGKIQQIYSKNKFTYF